ncbi:RNA-directed DNA polymerase, eukaryota, reverse transcriptase zinc-binding domain protein [Tanacetum coccineum]
MVDERLVWIEIAGLPLCAWGLNALKKVTSLFGKFKFFDSEEEDAISIGRVLGTWSTSILNDSDDSESKDKFGDEESRTSNGDENSNEDIDDYIEQIVEENANSNSIKEPLHENKEDVCQEPKSTDSKPPEFEKIIEEEENPHVEPGIQEAMEFPKEDGVKADNSDYSIPPCFGSLFRGEKVGSHSSSKSRVSKYSTFFCKYKQLDRKGFSFIDEMNKMIEVGDALGYDVKGCKRSLRKLINGNIILFGDLNEVRYETKRIGSSFSRRDAENFNAFIHDASLIDLPMGGRRFTWMNKTGSKLSKLDRFLISNSVFLEHLNLQVTVLEKVWLDHNLILLHCMKSDFGPIPFKIFHSWFDRNDFDDVVKEAWSCLSNADEGPLLSLNGKVKDEKIDAGMASEEEKILRVNNWYELDNLEKLESKDLFQKARVKWDVEGDENSKFFHGIINSKRNTKRIHGIMHEGVWISEPNAIKSAFLIFFKEKFSCHDSLVSFPPMTAAKRLTDSKVTYLDSMVSLEEIKNAVWDCGSQKAPGSDGFSFMFIKKYWDLLHLDIQNFVDSFFSTGTFHRIVAKILANRLSKVIDSVISHEQSAFIAGRQILEGPLILSEVIDWYKKRKKKMLFFKVDFKKAFDSTNPDSVDKNDPKDLQLQDENIMYDIASSVEGVVVPNSWCQTPKVVPRQQNEVWHQKCHGTRIQWEWFGTRILVP